MQESDQPRRAGRPSLLSEQPPPGGSHSILSKLDDRPAAGGRRPVPARRRSGRAAGVVALLLAAGGGLAWMAAGSHPETERPVTVAAPAQAMAPPAVAAPPQPASIPVSVPAPAPDTHKSVAAILEDTPHLSDPAPAPIPASGKGDKDELLTLLDTPPKTAAKAAEKPARAAVKVAQADKPARKEKAKEKEKEKARAAAAKKPPAKAAPPVDTDVALLAALLAHTKKAPAPVSGKAARELKRCAALGTAAEVDQCRARVCGGEAKAAPECKPPRVAKALD